MKKYQKLGEAIKDYEDVYIKTDIFSGSIKDLILHLEELDTRIVVVSDKYTEKEKTNNHTYNLNVYEIARKAYCPVMCVRCDNDG